jgi:maltodextrin utilization protein YvdJ
MTAALNAFTSDGYFVITFPEASVPAPMRDEFISTVKAEWLARQSKLTATNAKLLADKVDASWWQQNKARILESIGQA